MASTALFIVGGWEGHDPRGCVDLVAPLIEAAGLEPIISESLDSLADVDALRSHRVIVPAWTMGRIDSSQETALAETVASGVGLAGWHGGMGDAFRGNPHYQFLVGGQFVAHPGDFIEHVVHINDIHHPITRGLEDFTLTTEQYYMHVDPSIQVLASTRFSGATMPWIEGCEMPVTWVRTWGQGRVAYCSIGHGVDELRIREVQEMVRRGILWAAGVDEVIP